MVCFTATIFDVAGISTIWVLWFDEVIVPVTLPEKFGAVNVDVEGLYVNGAMVSANNCFDTPTDGCINGIVYAPDVLSLVTNTVVAVVAVVAFPVNDPTNVLAVNVPVLGTHENGVVILSTNNTFPNALVELLNNG
jgi:hypothetical protein